MRYTYDPEKRRANLKKHGLDLERAWEIIESASCVTFEDRRFAYDEIRYVTLGLLDGEVFVLVTSESDDQVRVISLRKADRHEQKITFENR